MTAAATVPAAASAEGIPNPINPSTGEASLLEIIDGLPLNEIESALDHFPIPYVIIASAGGAAPTIKNDNAGSPTRIDADDSAATGRGGKDVIVEVNTELLPTPHLNLSIDGIGTPPFAEDHSVIVAFPFSAFSDEALPGDPNQFFGYSTTGQFDGDGYPAGGHAPTSVDIDRLRDIAIREPVAQVPAHGEQDHLWRKPEASERTDTGGSTTNHPGTLRPAPNPSTQQCLRPRVGSRTASVVGAVI